MDFFGRVLDGPFKFKCIYLGVDQMGNYVDIEAKNDKNES